MSDTTETKTPLVIDGQTGTPDPHPPTASDIPLSTALDVRREQAKVYREARGGKIDKQDAAKLVWMLGEIRKSIETDEIERRISDLEGRTAPGRPALPARAPH